MGTNTTKTQTISLPKEMPNEKGDGVRPERTFKKLTKSEIWSKRAKGLCFHCDEKFSPGHRCKDRKLQVLIVCDEDEDVAEEEELDGAEKSIITWI